MLSTMQDTPHRWIYRDPAPEKFHDGWLRTGDVGTVDAHGFVQITDRAKDVGAAVIGVPDPRWEERPLACVVTRPGARPTAEALQAFLGERVARWWVPERWSFIDEVPKTSVGKFDKKVLRARHAGGALTVVGAASTRAAR